VRAHGHILKWPPGALQRSYRPPSVAATGALQSLPAVTAPRPTTFQTNQRLPRNKVLTYANVPERNWENKNLGCIFKPKVAMQIVYSVIEGKPGVFVFVRTEYHGYVQGESQPAKTVYSSMPIPVFKHTK
jgi:hypothetical protein